MLINSAVKRRSTSCQWTNRNPVGGCDSIVNTEDGGLTSATRAVELERADRQRVVGNFTVDNKNELTGEGNLQRL